MTRYNAFLHHGTLKYFHYKEVDGLYLSAFIKLLGQSFISIFTGIYLLSLHFSVIDVTKFYIIYFFMLNIAMTGGMYLNTKFGVKKTLALGTAFYIAFYYLLPQIAFGLSYYIVAFIYGLAAGFYFSAFNIEVQKTVKKNNEAKELSIIKILSLFAGILGPLIGAFIIIKFSFPFLYTLTALCMSLSVLPLFFTEDYKVPFHFSFKELLTIDSTRRSVAYQLFGGVTVAIDILWPLFLYLYYPNIIALGGIVSFTSLVVMLLMYYTGRFIDQNSIRAYKVGVLSHAPTWIVRLLLVTPFGLLISNLLSTSTLSLVEISLDKSFYAKSRQVDNVPLYILYRDYSLCVGRVGVLCLAYFISNWTILFILLGILTLLCLILLPDLRGEHNKS